MFSTGLGLVNLLQNFPHMIHWHAKTESACVRMQPHLKNKTNPSDWATGSELIEFNS